MVHWGIEGPVAARPAGGARHVHRADALGGQSLHAAVQVLKDPAIGASDADLAASTAAQLRIRDDMNGPSASSTASRCLRRQIEDD